MRLFRSLWIALFAHGADSSSRDTDVPLPGDVVRDEENRAQQFQPTDTAIRSQPVDDDVLTTHPDGVQSISSATDTARTVSDGNYIMAAARPGRLQRRQDDVACRVGRVETRALLTAQKTYLSPDGTYSNDCATAPIYMVRDGSLSTVLEGVTYTYSTNPGVQIQPFTPSLQNGSITTRFSFGGDGAIVWRNSAFDNGQAQFCVLDNGTTYAIFAPIAVPTGCINTRLLLFLVSSCAAWTARWGPTTVRVPTTVRETFTLPERVVVTTFVTTQSASTVTTTAVVTKDASTITTTYATTFPASTFTTTETRNIVTTEVRSVTQTQTYTTATLSIRPAATVTTTQAQLPSPAACTSNGVNNTGFQYAVFNNNQPPHDANQVYSNYDPTYMKVRPPGNWSTLYYTAVAYQIPGYLNNCANGAANVSAYGNGLPFPCQQISHLYRGYLYVYSTGTWTFTVSRVDDGLVVWAGPLARTGWTKPNSNLSLAFSYYTKEPTGSFQAQLNAGTYLPLRFALGQ